MRVRTIVTGGAGFIGSHLCERLLGLGHDVVCADTFDPYYDPAVKRNNLSAAAASGRFRLVEADILDANFGDRVGIDQGDVLVHLAARAGVRPSVEDPGAYVRTNVQGTVNLLEIARRRGVRHVVVASSSSVYGLTRMLPFREDDPDPAPASPYGASKLAAEVFCRTFHSLYGLPATCLRFFTVYGPRQRPDMAIHKFARFIEEGRPIPVYGDGSSKRDYTYVDDVIDGVVRAIERPNGFQIYNLGGDATVELRELIATLERVLGKTASISPQPDQPGDMPVTSASIERAARDLGYAPRVAIEEGIRRFAEWFRASGESASPAPERMGGHR
jgi:UDP-glucuronate 4-epimerase